MKGLEGMLTPLLNILEVSVPDAEPENKVSEFVATLIEKYVPENLPKDLVRKFMVDAVNKNPNEFEKFLRELYMEILHFLNSIER